MYTHRYCPNCGADFTPTKRSDQKFCQYTCGKLYWAKQKRANNRPKERICKHCQSSFQPYKGTSKFCSILCYRESWKEEKREDNQSRHDQNPLTCIHCQNLFVPRRHINEQFCSSECKVDHHAAEAKRKRAEVRANTTRTCPICDTVFSPKKSLKEIYCSPNCRKAIGRKIYKMMATVYKKCGTDKEDHSHEVLGYSASDLLEKLKTFPQWERLKHGTWHLDHIFPIIAFVRRGIKDASVICSLDNLQPLPGSKNCSKNDKYDETTFEEWLNGRMALASEN